MAKYLNIEKMKIYVDGKYVPISEYKGIENADIVEIIRCEDCKHRHTYECPIGLWVGDNWFCYRGERKETE